VAVTVAFTEQALKDIEDIATYIANDSLFYASLQVQKIFSKVLLLENFPLAGRVVPDLNLKSGREIMEGHYRIIYKVLGEGSVHIITVHHSRKLLKRSYLKKISEF
jgi:addiction module RelE/StbE family toxin